MFEGPHIAFVSECISWAEVNGLHPPHPPYPVLIMVDTAIVDHFGVPKEGDASLKESAAYVGRRPRRGIADVDKERPAGVSSNKPTFEREAPAHFKVLIVLEGSTDTTTALVFADIADTVHDGLSELGHTTKTVYCVNLATDNCFDEAEHLIVLAPHNLASYFTLEGKLAVLEGNMLPSDAGEALRYGSVILIMSKVQKCLSIGKTSRPSRVLNSLARIRLSTELARQFGSR